MFSQIERLNSLNFSVFGHSESIIALEYERFFVTDNDNLIFLVGAGVGRNPGADEYNQTKFPATTSVPIVTGILYGNQHYVQLKFGYTSIFSKDFVNTNFNPAIVYKKYQSDFPVSLGYRLMLPDGIDVQGYPVFIWSNNPSEKFKISFGVSLGYAF